MAYNNNNNNTRGRPGRPLYLRGLNLQDNVPVDDFTIPEEDFQKELDLFTNTRFFDSDSGQHTDYQQPPPKPDAVDSVELSSAITEDGTANDSLMSDLSMDFMSGDFNYGEFSSNYTTPTIPTFPDHLSLQSIPPSAHQGYPAPPVQQAAQPGYGAQAPLVPGDRRQSDVGNPGSVMNFEEQTRRMAEEDKRRRNTAASARFRIKKKQREQALEKSAKEMTDRMKAYENRIQALETENKFLKSLVMEKRKLDRDEVTKLTNIMDSASIDKDAESDGKEDAGLKSNKSSVVSTPSETK